MTKQEQPQMKNNNNNKAKCYRIEAAAAITVTLATRLVLRYAIMWRHPAINAIPNTIPIRIPEINPISADSKHNLPEPDQTPTNQTRIKQNSKPNNQNQSARERGREYLPVKSKQRDLGIGERERDKEK